MITALVDFAQNLVVSLGYPGVFLASALENCILLPPSELFFPFLGFVAGTSRLALFPTILMGTLGALVGAAFWYGLGFWLGRAHLKVFLGRWGRFLGIRFSDVERAEAWFARFEDRAVLLGRVVPVVRTFISVPAGFVRMPFWKFAGLSSLGTIVWIGALTLGGFFLGENWFRIAPIVADYELVVELGLLVAVIVFALWLYRRRHR